MFGQNQVLQIQNARIEKLGFGVLISIVSIQMYFYKGHHSLPVPQTKMEHRLVSSNTHMSWQFTVHKLFQRRMVRVTEWHAKMYVSSYLAQDGVILVPSVYEFASLFPVGLCECGACGALWLPDQNDRMYWDHEELMIICGECKTGRDVQTVMMISMTTSDIRGDPSVHINFEEHVDTLSALASAHRFAANCADDLGMYYFNGKNSSDLYHDMLAKRVVGRWRKMMDRKLRERLTWVFQEKLNMSHDTCKTLALNVKTM